MMRVLLVVLLVAALTLSQGLAQRDLESEPAAEERGRRRVECTTLDGLQGVCRRANRCPADRLALTNTETVCPGGRRRVKICCPRRRQGGNRGGGFNQGGTTSEINLGGSIGGASQGGSAGGGFRQGRQQRGRPQGPGGGIFQENRPNREQGFGGGRGSFGGFPRASSSRQSFGGGPPGANSPGLSPSPPGTFGLGSSGNNPTVSSPGGSPSRGSSVGRGTTGGGFFVDVPSINGSPSDGSLGGRFSGNGLPGRGSFGGGSFGRPSSPRPSSSAGDRLGSGASPGGGFPGPSPTEGSSSSLTFPERGSFGGGSFEDRPTGGRPAVAGSFGVSPPRGGTFGGTVSSVPGSTGRVPTGSGSDGVGSFGRGPPAHGASRPDSSNYDSFGNSLSASRPPGVDSTEDGSFGPDTPGQVIFGAGRTDNEGGSLGGGSSGNSLSGGGEVHPTSKPHEDVSEDAAVLTSDGSGECGRSTPLTIWSRRRRAAQDGPSQPDKPTTPSLFEIRIVGGKNAEIGKWPWIALIGSKQGSRPPFWFCGGTLIASQYVLTAAHCLKPRAVNVAHLVIRLGEHDTSRTDEGTILQDLGVLSFANHENFQFPVLHDDISLIKLERPVVYTDFIKPVCLPPAPEGDYAGTVIDVAGWGYTEFKGESSEILQEVSLPVVGIQECQSKYESSSSFQVQFPGGFGETKLCAAEKGGGKDACQGDSGGPMVRQLADGRYELVGVVSAGVGCGTPGFPGLYTRVSAYLDWIRQKMV
ncbi:uncharacterized transmembrane protein DDB_G0289901-like isoform X2 [Pollicipes pollicipes]|uniref:uncharacterized transmembrane protein DDB_G0289901-like isoform X2 n=1 Tax=Pollicipes pollicipes TaxID=41117 RepID=UPI0018851F4C|nr:uncharacterized transmembrane protein DDB_G0289901-like isoform X2 [Pollicipes pollicipes]